MTQHTLVVSTVNAIEGGRIVSLYRAECKSCQWQRESIADWPGVSRSIKEHRSA